MPSLTSLASSDYDGGMYRDPERTAATPGGRPTTALVEPNAPTCQINVGTQDNPRTCGQGLKKLTDWSWECRHHGPVY
jgi:hypothetical protein